MANEQNLVPFTSDQSHEEAVKNGRKGGKASGRKRKKKKLLAEIAEQMGRTIAPDSLVDDLRKAGVVGSDELITYDEAIMLAQYVKAAKGNVQSAAFLRDTAGQKPAERVRLDNLDSEQSKLNELLKQRREKNESQ